MSLITNPTISIPLYYFSLSITSMVISNLYQVVLYSYSTSLYQLPTSCINLV